MFDETGTSTPQEVIDNNLQEKFHHFFPSGSIQKISLDNVPKEALEIFENQSRSYIRPDDYHPGSFENILVVNHEGGDKTFIAKQTKTYRTNGETENLIYIVDVDPQGHHMGDGEIRKNLSNNGDYFKDKPFVGYTETDENYQGKGLGSRRLLLMNALTQMFYNHPLHSDTLITPQAKSLWEKIVLQGKAQKYREGTNDRYSFI